MKLRSKYIIKVLNRIKSLSLIQINSLLNSVLFIVLFTSINISCDEFVDVGSPKDQIINAKAFSNDDIATSAITGIYSRMIQNGFTDGGIRSVTLLAGLSADELINYSSSSDQSQFFNNEILTTNSYINLYIWGDAYEYIYTANSLLEGLANSTNVTIATKRGLEGEAKFVRAFCYFYLVNLFNEVPLHTTSDYQVNATALQSSVDAIYQQIITDLQEAQDLLSDDYVTNERVRPNRYTALALLARVYLYVGNWSKAEDVATDILSNTATYSLEADLNNVFLKNSSEAIWQLMPNSGNNTKEGAMFIPTSTPRYAALSNEFLAAFEIGDKRKENWIDSITVNSMVYYYPFKYKVRSSSVVTEYSTVFRLVEQYLIRSEARAKLGDISGAVDDLNTMRQRAGLDILSSSLTLEQCLDVIEQERRIELFAEWGHRWLDLKRWNKIDERIAVVKHSTWQATDALYPIPQVEIDRNVNINQNLGY